MINLEVSGRAFPRILSVDDIHGPGKPSQLCVVEFGSSGFRLGTMGVARSSPWLAQLPYHFFFQRV